MKAIGLAGFAGSGKTAVATYLETTYAATRMHIAEPLRAMLRPLFAAHGIDPVTMERYLVGDLKESVVPGIGKTSRELQISLGTEWGRRLVSDTLWCDAWERAVEAMDGDELALNDSVRFPNEAEAIFNLDGIVIKLVRPGVGPAKFKAWWGKPLYRLTGLMWGAHDSERVDRIRADIVIRNDGTLDDLYGQIDKIMDIEGIIPRGDTQEAIAA